MGGPEGRGGAFHTLSHPCIRPICSSWLVSMSKASERIAGHQHGLAMVHRHVLGEAGIDRPSVTPCCATHPARSVMPSAAPSSSTVSSTAPAAKTRMLRGLRRELSATVRLPED
jgi:hypothetical protein